MRKIFGILAVIIAIVILAVPAFAMETENGETASFMPHLLFGEELDELLEGMSEEEVLAKFIDYEGGEIFERTLIAEIVCDLRLEWNVETVQDVLTDRKYFCITQERWNSFKIPSKESQMIAHMVLEASTYQEGYLSKYNEYYYPDWVTTELEYESANGKSFFKTRNFVFVER